jgi:hypothetical protein
MNFVRLSARSTFIAIISLMITSNLLAGAFQKSANSSLVIVRLGDDQTSVWDQVNAPVFLDEYDVSDVNKAVLINTVAIPATGATCMTLISDTDNSDGHLHLSTNKQFLTFMGYRASVNDVNHPDAESAIDYPRVVCRVDLKGNVDATTALVDDCNWGAVRGAVTDDGTRFWTAGDNASGANEGGLRFSLLGATHSVNLSYNQVPGSSGPTTDNPRDVAIADGQLYVGSGSASSIGKTLVKTTVPLPTSGSQTYIKLYSEAAAASNFVFLDLSPAIPGVDTVYTISTNPANTVRKYSKTFVSGVETWVLNGTWIYPGPTDIAAAKVNGQVVIFISNETAIYRIVDSSGYNGAISGNHAGDVPYISADSSIEFRGLEILPVRGDVNLDGVVDFRDFAALAGNWLTTGSMSWNNGDLTGDKNVSFSDMAVLAGHWLDTANLGKLQ